jgi:hypothetical protein
MFVCCERCVLSGRGLCDEVITCPEESYRLWCVVMCNLENLVNEETMTRVGSQRHRKNNGAIFLKTLLLMRICQNFKFPNAKFLILHGIGSWNCRFLHYGHKSMHHHIDWNKNSCRKVLKDLDYLLYLPLNEFKRGLLIALIYIVCKLVYIKKTYIRSIKF